MQNLRRKQRKRRKPKNRREFNGLVSGKSLAVQTRPRNEVQNAIRGPDARANSPKRYAMIKTAIILKYDIERGYGFLLELDNSRHFFHITSCIGFIPQPGMTVTFQIGQGRKGPAAINLELVPAAPSPDVSAGIGVLAGDTSKSERGR